MANTTQVIGENLEFLVQTALTHGELSPGVATAIEKCRQNSRLTTVERRYLKILEGAIADGCIAPIKSPTKTV